MREYNYQQVKLRETIDKMPADRVRQFYQELLEDTADTDTAVRRLAMRVLPENQVAGDSFGVPSIETIVEALVNKIEAK